MYRAGLEAILGLTREGSMLRVKPCIPDGWDEFEVAMQLGATRYELKLIRPGTTVYQMPSEVEAVSPREYLIKLCDVGGVRQIVLPVG